MDINAVNNSSLIELKEKIGVIPKMSKRFHKYAGILARGIITKSETTSLKSILSNNALRGNLNELEVERLTEMFTQVEIGQVRITKEHTEQGLNFFKSLIYTPRGKVRAKWKTYLGNIDCDSTPDQMKYVLSNFSHFELAGFEGTNYNNYTNSYNYSPIWRAVGKDSSTFEYTQVCVSEATQRGNWTNYKK